VLAVAWSPGYLMFFLAWVRAGAASAGLFYAPAFAALTGWYGERSVRAITTLTLAGGFASTVFAPLTDALASRMSWRETYLVLAVVLLVVTLPLHAAVLRRPWPHRRWPPTKAPGTEAGGRDREILRSRTFVLATTAGTLMAFASFASLVYLVPLLVDRGMSTAWAAWALGLGGAGQVAGRVFYPWMTRRIDARTRAVLVITAMAAALLGLAAVPGPTGVVVLLAVLAGGARGLFTLVGATLVSDYWGRERYAAISGVYNAPMLAAGALAPLLGAVVVHLTGGYVGLFVVLTGTAAVAAVLAAGVAKEVAPHPREVAW
jgi:predicted MFS family arabinose efflux permease